jgi:hypothetical protein
MVSHKPYAPRLLAAALVLIGLLLLAAPFVQGNEQKPSGSHERLQELLVQRHRLLKEIVESLQEQVNLGLRDPSVLSAATIALYRAEADLCTTNAERIAV